MSGQVKLLFGDSAQLRTQRGYGIQFEYFLVFPALFSCCPLLTSPSYIPNTLYWRLNTLLRRTRYIYSMLHASSSPALYYVHFHALYWSHV